MQSDLLDYEKSILIDTHDESTLLVCAEGLSIDCIVYNMIRVHCDPHNLVLICNHSVNEANFLIKALKEAGEEYPPQIITAEVSQKERELIYRRGGVVFVSSRILVVDLLNERMPVSLVNTVIILRAHQLQSSCQDAFVVRLLRERNDDLTVKALTDNALAINSGSLNAETLMKQLLIPKLVLWPRFRAELIDSFQQTAPVLEEVKVPLTELMANCQSALLELMQGTIRDLASQNNIFKGDEFNLENALSSSFDRMTSLYLDPVWHELTSSIKQLLNDLSNLRRLLHALIDRDAFGFLQQFESLRQNAFGSVKGTRVGDCSAWLLMDQADKLLVSARKRVHKDGKKGGDYQLETNGKCATIGQLLAEIARSLEDSKEDSEASHCRPVCVLILVTRAHTVTLLQKFLEVGAEGVEQWLTQPDSEDGPLQQADLLPGCYPVRMSGALSSVQVILRHPPAGCLEECAKSSLDAGGMDPSGRLFHVLQSVKPTHIITYEPRVCWVREIETYTARLPLQTGQLPGSAERLLPVTVYFMLYADSVEEQRYLTALRREKTAFENLIKLSSTIVVPKSLDQPPALAEDGEGSLVAREQPTVFVDMREFRSELPSVLHSKGLKVTPLTLSVGDYILAPHLAVERKSVSDLIGSLNSGHLYQQCMAMSRHFVNPILLIEFSSAENRTTGRRGIQTGPAFSLFTGRHSVQNQLMAGGQLNVHHLLSRLVLLTVHFPMLRLVWSVSPHATAELFCEMKLSRPEPSLEKLPKEGGDHLDDHNIAAVDMLLRIPGINWTNYQRVISRVENLRELTKLSVDELADILDNRGAAEKVHTFLHDKYVPPIVNSGEADNTASSASTSKPKMHLAGRVKRRNPAGKAADTSDAPPQKTTLDAFCVTNP